jgi:hypothetical protein
VSFWCLGVLQVIDIGMRLKGGKEAHKEIRVSLAMRSIHNLCDRAHLHSIAYIDDRAQDTSTENPSVLVKCRVARTLKT